MPEKTDYSPDMETDRDTRRRIEGLLAKLETLLAQAREMVLRLKGSFTDDRTASPVEPEPAGSGARARGMEMAPPLERGGLEDDPPTENSPEEEQLPDDEDTASAPAAEDDPEAVLNELAEDIADGVAEVAQPAAEEAPQDEAAGAEAPAGETAAADEAPEAAEGEVGETPAEVAVAAEEEPPAPTVNVTLEVEHTVVINNPLIVSTPSLSIDQSSAKFHMLGALERARKTTLDKVEEFKDQGRDLTLEEGFRNKDSEQKAVFTLYTTKLLDDTIPVTFADVEVVQIRCEKIKTEPDADRFVGRVDKLTTHIRQQLPSV